MSSGRNRNTRGRRVRRKQRRSAAPAIVSVILVLGIIYFAAAGVTGKWVADNIIAPVYDTIAGKPTPSSPQLAPSASATAAQATGRKQQVTVKEFKVYCIQMGAFSSNENAQKGADELVKQGGGGYVIDDAGKFRLLAFGYAKEADAKSVRDNLMGQQIDCSVFELVCEELQMEVIDPTGKLGDIQPVFDDYETARTELAKLALQLDENKTSVQDAQAAVKELSTGFKAKTDALGSAGGAQAVAPIFELLGKCNQELTKVTNDGDSQSLSAGLKYAYLALSHNMSEFVKSYKTDVVR